VSEVKTFFRYCPACGRRFHIKLVSKTLVSLDRQSTDQKQAVPGTGSLSGGSGGYYPSPFALQEGETITIDIEHFQYSYLCKHCGHGWSEKGVEEHKEHES
jgi:hypothetical protein